MAEYVKRSKVMKICVDYSEHCFDSNNSYGQDIADRILDDVSILPSADVVEVVRCKDCVNRYIPTRCSLWYGSLGDKEYFLERGDDFHCAFGTRKTQGEGG